MSLNVSQIKISSLSLRVPEILKLKMPKSDRFCMTFQVSVMKFF